ncbi:MAG: DnaA/Hda family protein [Planctomycetota bacterium]|nr:DnaA/Hda family protein [Planctomycetota bacterium]
MHHTSAFVDCGPDSTSTIKQALCSALKKRLGARKYELWFQDNAQIDLCSGAIRVTAQTQFAADWIDRHFRLDLLEISRTLMTDEPKLVMHVQPSTLQNAKQQPVAAETEDVQCAETFKSQTHRKMPTTTARNTSQFIRREDSGVGWKRFDDFLVAAPNRLAYESARQVAEVEGDPLRLLFLHGSCGVGKSHLLQSICRRFRERNPQAKVRYATGEQFTNEFIAAIREDNIEQFRRKTRRLDLLVIDDVHFLGNKTATQSECLHTIDAIGFHGSRMVLASDAHPRQIAKFSAALVSRFLSGMVVKVDDPDRATRVALATQFALRRGLALPPAAIETLVDRAGASVREIEGAVMTIAAVHSLGGIEMGNGQILVERALGRVTTSHVGRPVRVAEILQAVCTTTGIEREDLVGIGRHRKVVTARGLAAHLAREMTTLSFPEIATALGRSSHSTIHAAAARFRNMIERSELLSTRNDQLTAADLSERTRREVLRGRA